MRKETEKKLLYVISVFFVLYTISTIVGSGFLTALLSPVTIGLSLVLLIARI